MKRPRDVNSTLACALIGAKLGVRVAHVEAGLRSRDRTMPEEINRVLTDHLADLLFTPSREAGANLLREGVAPARIKFVGNVMIDSLERMLPTALRRPILDKLDLRGKPYALVTIHRRSNVDAPATLAGLLSAIDRIAQDVDVVFPMHPGTSGRLSDVNVTLPPGVRLLDPLSYLDFLVLLNSAKIVVTDSGGVQEESSYLGIPCLTCRKSTERPLTERLGTNRLVGTSPDAIVDAFNAAFCAKPFPRPSIELWDGKAAMRIVDVLASGEFRK